MQLHHPGKGLRWWSFLVGKKKNRNNKKEKNWWVNPQESVGGEGWGKVVPGPSFVGFGYFQVSQRKEKMNLVVRVTKKGKQVSTTKNHSREVFSLRQEQSALRKRGCTFPIGKTRFGKRPDFPPSIIQPTIGKSGLSNGFPKAQKKREEIKGGDDSPERNDQMPGFGKK